MLPYLRGPKKVEHFSKSHFIETKDFNSGRCTTTKHVSLSSTCLVTSPLKGIFMSLNVKDRLSENFLLKLWIRRCL